VNSVILYNTGILYNIKSDYPAAIVQLEQSIARNKENVYAYLALGDAYERNGEERQALGVYKELMHLGIKVHGLKEKIAQLENAIAQKEKAETAKKLAQKAPQ
jgi:tetratricopeptide (TPR) repeat protein